MSAQEVGIFPVKPDEQGSELINPGKTMLVGKATFINIGIEQAFATSLRSLAVARVLRAVRDDTVIEADLPCGTGIKGAIGVEERPGDVSPHRFMPLNAA